MKFGLTFQTAADARAFDRAVRVAIEDLLEGKQSFRKFLAIKFLVDIQDPDLQRKLSKKKSHFLLCTMPPHGVPKGGQKEKKLSGFRGIHICYT